jgi:hypothetical protein
MSCVFIFNSSALSFISIIKDQCDHIYIDIYKASDFILMTIKISLENVIEDR